VTWQDIAGMAASVPATLALVPSLLHHHPPDRATSAMAILSVVTFAVIDGSAHWWWLVGCGAVSAILWTALLCIRETPRPLQLIVPKRELSRRTVGQPSYDHIVGSVQIVNYGLRADSSTHNRREAGHRGLRRPFARQRERPRSPPLAQASRGRAQHTPSQGVELIGTNQEIDQRIGGMTTL